MTEPTILLTGFEPFAGLPTNPAELVARRLDGARIAGARVVSRPIPVDLARLPKLLPALVAETDPVAVLALGLANGAALLAVEKVAINAVDFAIPDQEGRRPTGGVPIDPEGPPARRASWNAEAVVTALLDAGLPARASYSAGTHLCNLTLYTLLGALGARPRAVPCGFLHLPYLPEHIVWLIRNRPEALRGAQLARPDQPSMPLDLQVEAARIALAGLAAQALTVPGEADA